MKLLLIVYLCIGSCLVWGQEKYKNHKFQAEFIALDYLLDSIVPFNEDLKDRLLVSRGEIDPAPIHMFISPMYDYKDLRYMYYEWEKERYHTPNKIDTLYGGGWYCPRKHGLKKMSHRAYRKRLESGEMISRVGIASMVYDAATNEKLVRIHIELEYDFIDGVWYEAIFAVLDGEIIYRKFFKDNMSRYRQ
jgi:hypothetical protein